MSIIPPRVLATKGLGEQNLLHLVIIRLYCKETRLYELEGMPWNHAILARFFSPQGFGLWRFELSHFERRSQNTSDTTHHRTIMRSNKHWSRGILNKVAALILLLQLHCSPSTKQEDVLTPCHNRLYSK